MTKLSPRLEEISNLIENNEMFIDIGCDHGFLSISLAKKYPNSQIIASDINENALNNAKKNIQKCHLEEKITLTQSNGLEKINPSKKATIIISGMGSHTIVGILNQGYKKLKNVSTLILQSNNDLDFLRKKVTSLGYYIQKEKLVSDANIIYTIIVFQKGFRFYTKKQIYLGPYLLKENTNLFQKKAQQDLQKLESFYQKIPKGHYQYRHLTHWKIKILKKTLAKNEYNNKKSKS